MEIGPYYQGLILGFLHFLVVFALLVLFIRALSRRQLQLYNEARERERRRDNPPPLSHTETDSAKP